MLSKHSRIDAVACFLLGALACSVDAAAPASPTSPNTTVRDANGTPTPYQSAPPGNTNAVVVTGNSNAIIDQVITREPPTFTLPLASGYQADPMMVTFNGQYYMYVDDQLGYDRIRTSSSIRGLSSAESQVIFSPPNNGVVDPSVSCAYMIPWQNRWYQYCGDSNGNLVLASDGNNPLGPYSLAGRLDAPPGYTGYATFPIIVGANLYLLITINGNGQAYNSIWIAQLSNPVTRSSPWSMIVQPTGGAGSWECADGRCIDEGGSAMVHGGKVFVAFSAGGYESPDYCVGLVTASTSADLTRQSSWTKSPGCVVASNGGASAYGPGSLIFFKSPDGTEDWAAYHAKSSSDNNYNGDDRYILASRITWDANDNPVFAAPYGQSTSHALPSGDNGLTLSAPGVAYVDTNTFRVYALGEANYDLWQVDYSGGTWSSWVRSDDPVPEEASLGPVAISRFAGGDSVFVTASGTTYARDRAVGEGAGWLPLARTNPSACQSGSCSAPNSGARAGVAHWGTARVQVLRIGAPRA